MKTSTKWIIGIVAAVVVGTPLAFLLSLLPIRRTVGEPITPDPVPVTTPVTTTVTLPPVVASDGILVAWVVPTDDGATLDDVQILTGDAAHDAAVAAGIIGEDEDLPNDMFVADIAGDPVTVPVLASVVIDMISGGTPGTTVRISYGDLLALLDGSYDATPVYGVAEGEPVLMTVTVESGVISALEAVYLP